VLQPNKVKHYRCLVFCHHFLTSSVRLLGAYIRFHHSNTTSDKIIFSHTDRPSLMSSTRLIFLQFNMPSGSITPLYCELPCHTAARAPSIFFPTAHYTWPLVQSNNCYQILYKPMQRSFRGDVYRLQRV
jgi:hypothetical protein